MRCDSDQIRRGTVEIVDERYCVGRPWKDTRAAVGEVTLLDDMDTSRVGRALLRSWRSAVGGRSAVIAAAQLHVRLSIASRLMNR
jgi:hypothetical protein